MFFSNCWLPKSCICKDGKGHVSVTLKASFLFCSFLVHFIMQAEYWLHHIIHEPLSKAHKNLDRKAYTVCRNLKWRFILFRGQILFFPLLSAYATLSFSHYPRASYLHENCISVVHRGSIVASFEAPTAYSDSLQKVILMCNWHIFTGRKSEKTQRKCEGEKRGIHGKMEDRIWAEMKTKRNVKQGNSDCPPPLGR